MKINKHYLELKESYLFSTIAKKVNEFEAANADKAIIKMGIGDVTMPLCQAVIDEMQKAVSDMGQKETFKGYGPEQGYAFLREKIVTSYADKGITVGADEIFVGDGAKSDLGNILDILGKDNKVLIPDPVYPVYVDTNTMDGREIAFLQATKENNFLPMPDESVSGDIIYLCSPNNPTGAVYTKEQLKVWVDYAIKQDAIILFDAAYECFIQDETLPKSIFEIEGADKCAIEFCSYSKMAGFTGVRCGYTVVPHTLVRENTSLNKLWLRRQTTKFNGVSYIVQRAASALYTEQGQKEYKAIINTYLENARIIRETFDELGMNYIGGVHSPYIWFECIGTNDSWAFFDNLLEKAQVVGTPGAGFGTNGEGYFRMSAFNTKENTIEAMRRIKELYK